MAINFDSLKLFYGIPIKDENEIKTLYDKGCRYFIYTSIEELEKLLKYAPEAKKILRIKVSDISDSSIPYGFDVSKFNCKMLKNTDGYMFHISNTKLDEHIKMLDMIEVLFRKHKIRNVILNVGGSYSYEENDDFFEKYNNRLLEIKNKFDLNVFAEPGSAIVNRSGKLITKVIHVEKKGKVSDVYIDAGVSSGVYCVPNIIHNASKKNKTASKYYRFFDTSCLRHGLFLKKVRSEIEVGDILYFDNYGAYSLCYINRFHNKYDPVIRYI